MFITNASEKDVLFKAKVSLVRLLHLACFKIDCLTPLDRALKEKGKLNMCTNSRFTVWLLRTMVSAKLEGYIFGCYLVFIDVVSIFFVYTDMAVVFAAKLSSESFERMINYGRI